MRTNLAAGFPSRFCTLVARAQLAWSAAAAHPRAQRQLRGRVGRPDQRRGGDARRPLQAAQPGAERIDVRGRPDLQPLRAVLEPHAIPARPHEARRRVAAQPPRVAHRLAPAASCRRPRPPRTSSRGRRPARSRPRRAARAPAELQRRPELLAVDPHERVSEAVDAAVLLIARARAAADARRLARPRRVDVAAPPR